MDNFGLLVSTILFGSDVTVCGRIVSYKHHVEAEKVGRHSKQKHGQTSRDPV